MIRRRYIAAFLAVFFTQFTQAQEYQVNKTDLAIYNRYKNDYLIYNQAIELYNQHLYELAQIKFDLIKTEEANTELQANSIYYSAKCALMLEQPDAEKKMLLFIEQFPTSSKVVTAYSDLTTYFFNKENYAACLKYGKKVNTNVISENDLNKYYFELGYASFQRKDYGSAKSFLHTVPEKSEFYKQAQYYLGYIYYLENNYEEANKYFSGVTDVEKYQEKMGYFKADMYFKTGAFDKAIAEGLKQLPKSDANEKSELSKIIGESYFNLKQYTNALPYLLEYTGKDGKLSNTDYYQLGYTYYKLSDYERAVSYFNRIINGADEVAQNAYYHLGESYLKLNQKNQAFHAFKNASEMNNQLQIQEDAFANYAKLSYDIGNPYRNVSEVIQDFLSKYPKSGYRAELEQLLVDSYITTKDFKKAESILEKNKSVINKPIYQKVLFYRGIEEYNKKNYREAIKFFNRSIAERQDNKFIARATYWKAETLYALGQYNEALSSINIFEYLPLADKTPEFKDLNYFKGYLYLQTKKYSDAETSFEHFIQTTRNTAKRLDADIRLADVYFAEGKYNDAIDLYGKIERNNTAVADYVSYQKALSLGFSNQNSKKIEELNRFLDKYPTSDLADAALYELGKTYANLGQNSQAIATYQKLNRLYPSSIYHSKSSLNLGLVYYNSGNKEEAIKIFRDIAVKYPNTEEAIQAVQNARLAYNEMGQSAVFAQWVKSLDYIDISTAELEQDVYQVADKYKALNQYDKAIEGYVDYLKQYPQGNYSIASNFYLGELKAKSNEKDALQYFKNVVEKPQSEYTERALFYLADIYLKNNDTQQAKKYLSMLRDAASTNKNKEFALANLMKIAHEAKDYQTAEVYAKQLLSRNISDPIISADVYTILAREAMRANNLSEAKKYYATLEKIGSGEAVAEALYHKAFFENRDKKFEQSNKTIQKIAKNYAQYQYFGAKGLVLMAQNYYALNDTYQATYILESVIKNFTQFDDVKQNAEQLLKQYKAEVSKVNSSVK